MQSDLHKRKNWLHIGSLAAGMRAANLMTIISTAARNDLDVWAYLKDMNRMSHYQISLDTVSPMDGMLTAINEREWAELTPQTPSAIAAFLRRVSRHVNVRSYRKSVRGPKRAPSKRKRCKAGAHVSTHRLLQERKQRC